MRIFCLGDSNTYGFDPRGFFGDRYGAEDRWVDLLAKQTGYDCINEGVNGREIPLGSFALRSLPEPRDGDILLVMLGTNDLLQGASAAEAAARMEAFLNLLRLRFRQLVLIASPPMNRGAWVPEDALVTQSHCLAAQYALLAERLGTGFVDTRSWNVELTFDGVHFSEEGHHTFAENLIRVLRQSYPHI